jgi:XTP/dITP diphosphohydrolase
MPEWSQKSTYPPRFTERAFLFYWHGAGFVVGWGQRHNRRDTVMELILSTRNQSKAEQIRALLGTLPLRLLTLDDVGIAGEAVEDGLTLEENALKKARFAQEQTGKWAIADDTGLFIDALGGQPGIHAARWAGRDKSTEEIMLHTLGKLRDVLPQDRTATFRTVAVAVSPQGKEHAFLGEVRGVLLPGPRCAPQPKMPYSAIFMPDGQPKVWAEMTVEEENAISHRGRAFSQLREFLSDL